ALRAEGKKPEAISQFELALRLKPAYPEALCQLISISLIEKMPDQALERVRRQILLAPNSAALYEVLGGVHLARNEIELAESAYSKAIELDPRSFAAYLALGQIYARTKRYDEAEIQLDKVLTASPKDVRTLMLTGLVQQARGDVPKARAAYEK